MYNPPATVSHIRMASKTQINSGIEQAVDWIERHPWIVAAVFALLLAIQITPQFKMSPDGVSYMSIARNLILHGRLERLGSPHIRYAPGYPVFISPAFLLPRPFIGVQVLQWIYALVLMLGVYIWFARYAGRSAIWIAALTMASAGYWDLFRTASSEIVFAPCLIWAGVSMARCLDGRRSILALIFAIVLAALACATRQAGAMLVPGFVLAFILHARNGRIAWPRAVALAAAFAIFIAAVSWGLIAFDHWGIRQMASGETGYTAIFFNANRSFVGQIAEGARRQIAEVSRLLIPGMWKTHSREHEFLSVNNLIYAAVFIPVAIGWWRFCRETTDPFALSLPFFIALYIVYPYDSGTRFTVPVLAVLAGSIWFLLKSQADKRAAIFLVLIVIHTLVAIGFWLDDAAHVRRRYLRRPEMERVAAAIPPQARVIALRIDAPRGDFDDRWMFLMCQTDRPVAPETLNDPVAPSVDWIITSPTEPIQPGFQFVARIDEYKIEKRIALK
jgi:4-amino-4-deoxy-L-arabinose transferase-like glycosyltransferase